MHRAVAATLAAAALLVTACGTGSSSGSGLPTVGASTTAAPTTGPTASPATSTPAPDASPWTVLPTISEGPNKGVHSGVVLASSVAKTSDEKAVVDGYVAFWGVLVQIGLDSKVNKAALAAVAKGTAASDLKKYAGDLAKRGAQTIGWASINVTTISAGSDKGAFLKACGDNGSFDVNRSTGKRLEKGAVAFDAEAGLEKTAAGTWVVGYSKTTRRSNPCPADGGQG